MKTLLTLSVALIGFLGIGAGEVEARHYHQNGNVYVSGYLSCGTPIYSQRVFTGYDRCGYPVYVVRRVTVPRRQIIQRPVYRRPVYRRGYHRPVRVNRSRYGNSCSLNDGRVPDRSRRGR